ncbi:hypothetical protein [Xanthobacter sediminis]
MVRKIVIVAILALAGTGHIESQSAPDTWQDDACHEESERVHDAHGGGDAPVASGS